MSTRPRLPYYYFCAAILAAAPLSAQTSLGRISGSVTDPSGGAIPGAVVTARNNATRASRRVTTDNAGFYVIPDLPIGPYTVEVNQKGFAPQARSNLNITADARLTVNFQLALGDVTQTVEVTAAVGETVNTVSGELAKVVETKTVENTPLNGRNYTQLLSLVPGAVVTNPDQFAVTTSLSATAQTVNGNRSDTNNLTVDGAFNLVAGSNGSLMNNVGADFIQEVKIQTSNFSAEYGRMSGPAFNIVTKNGTNSFHGSAFEFFRNDKLDARNFFAAGKSPLRFNDFGYDVGGPIRKDKLFFFWGQEWKRLRQQATATRVTVPSSAQLAGNFAGQPQLFLPGTTTPIPNNNISSLITPEGRALANVYKRMSEGANLFIDQPVSNNLTLTPSNPLNFREEVLRLDYHLTDKHTLYGRWIQDSNVLIDPYGTFSGSNLPTTPTTRKRPGESFLIAHTWVPNGTIVNEARANTSWASQHIPPYGDTWQRSTYGFAFPQLYSGGQYDNGIPNVNVTGYANFRGPAFALMSPTTDIQFSDTVSIIRNPHLFKFGFIWIRDRVDQNGRPAYTGDITFNTAGNVNTTGNALADALLGNYRTYLEASADPVGFFRFSQPEAFVQDSWKVTRKLSLEIGLRWQHMQPMYTAGNNMANFVPGLFDPARAVSLTRTGTVVPGSGNPFNGLILAGSGVPNDQQGRVPGSTAPLFQSFPKGAPRGFYDTQEVFAPRFSFAFAPDSNTVVRGGYGLFYSRPEGNITFSQVNVPPILQITSFENGNLVNPAGGANVQAPVGNISALDPKLQISYSQQYSLGVQRQLPQGTMLEVSYVGNLGRHLLRQPDINQPAFSVLAANAALPSSQQFAVNALRPFAGFSSINQYRSDSTSNYHALQVYASKRGANLVATAGYTWSKCLADSSGQGDNPENYLDRHYSYGPCSFDRRHVFTGSFVWDLPRLQQSAAALRAALGAWQLSGIIRLQTGPYLTPTGNTAIGSRRADYLGGPVLAAHRDINNWIDKAAFAPANSGRFGNAGPGIVEAPGLQSFDLSLAKNFPFRDRYSLRFGADFFNAFNIANFNGLNVTVTDRGFGTISSAYPARNIQFGLKFSF